MKILNQTSSGSAPTSNRSSYSQLIGLLSSKRGKAPAFPPSPIRYCCRGTVADVYI